MFANRGPTSLFMQPNASAPAPIVRAGEDRVPDEYIVVLRDDALPEQVPALAARIASAAGAHVAKIWKDVVKGFFARMTEAQAAVLAANPLVKYVEENAKWYLSSSQQTNINPQTCNPLMGTCPAVADDRLWHLDRLDQNSASPNDTYSYCTDGTGVTVYVVDNGVSKFHNEFGPSGARVQPGFNASGDFMPADDPCLGFAAAPSGPYSSIEEQPYRDEITNGSHGTSVASALGGNRVGVAKNVTIVPVKTSRCDKYSARYRVSSHYYLQYQTMFRYVYGYGTIIYRALYSGYTAGTDPESWSTSDNSITVDNEVTWKVVPASEWQQFQTLQMIIDGLNWILSPANPGPKSYAVVTLSTYRLATDSGVSGATGTLEAAIRVLLANNITVIASANNQNGNACDTSPGRMSIDNPDSSVANSVITAGGSMIQNRPWGVDISDVPGTDVYEADGPRSAGGSYGLELPFDPTKGVRDARWTCGAGDSSELCSNDTATDTKNPSLPNEYYSFLGGSNAGRCVTLFAPAKNLFLATLAAADGYRDARLRRGNASGTSWSAPITAGVAARILQNHPTYTPPEIRTALLANSASTLDPATLNTFDYQGVEIRGTPNKMLQLSDVTITSQPTSSPAALSGTTVLTVGAGGTSTLSYQWYEVNSGFDYANYRRGALSSVSTQLAGATSSSYNVPPSSVRRAYWVRVTNSCGSADSDLAVVVPRPGAPANVDAVATGATVTVTWSAGSGADQYQIQRKIAGQAWTIAATVGSSMLNFSETPAAPSGLVLYRVLSVAGATYLPPDNLSVSAPSNNDFANVAAYTYENLTPMTIKAQHLIELRQAVNALCDAAGASQEFMSSELQLSDLQGRVIRAEHFTSLMTHINNIRTNPLVGVPAALFTDTPGANGTVKRQHLQSLRDALW